jgi:hypothetical protein
MLERMTDNAAQRLGQRREGKFGTDGDFHHDAREFFRQNRRFTRFDAGRAFDEACRNMRP